MSTGKIDTRKTKGKRKISKTGGRNGGRRTSARPRSKAARERQVRRQKRLLALGCFIVVLVVCLVLVRLGGDQKAGTVQEDYSINASCEAYRSQVQTIAADYGMESYTDLILALMMQESSGQGNDVMQSSECGYNEKYPQKPGGITDPAYSIQCGIQELKYALERAGAAGPEDIDRISMALQAYNFGTDVYLNYMEEQGLNVWSAESAQAFARWASGETARAEDDSFRETAGPWAYGDQYYPQHVLRYYLDE